MSFTPNFKLAKRYGNIKLVNHEGTNNDIVKYSIYSKFDYCALMEEGVAMATLPILDETTGKQ